MPLFTTRLCTTTLTLLWAMIGQPAAAQAPSTGQTAGCEPVCTLPPGRAMRSPPDNPHLRAGAQFGYRLAGSSALDDVSDFFAARTEVFFSKKADTVRFRIPVIGNFGKVDFRDPVDAVGKLQDLLNSTSGLQVTVSPFYSLPGTGPVSRTVFYANLGGKFNRQRAAEDSARYQWINQLRGSLGTDLSFDVGQPRPMSVIVEGVYGYIGATKAKALLGRDDAYLLSVEGTVIVPLPAVANLSLIAQGVALRGGAPLWRVGTLIYTPQKK